MSISDKQINFINILASNIGKDVIEFCRQHLKRDDIATLHDMKHFEIVKIINRLKGEQPLNIFQMREMSKTWTLETLSKVFKTEFKSWNDVRVFHYDMMKSEVKFKVKCVDHPQINTCEYEYGWQESDLCQDGKLWYLKFYNMLMLDYDGMTLEDVLKILEPWKNEFLFHIYKTHNGFHVYVVSCTIYFAVAHDFMLDMKCDFYYCKFVQRNGYKIRLTSKLGRDEKFIEQWVMEYGTGDVHEDIKPLLQIRAKFMKNDSKMLEK